MHASQVIQTYTVHTYPAQVHTRPTYSAVHYIQQACCAYPTHRWLRTQAMSMLYRHTCCRAHTKYTHMIMPHLGYTNMPHASTWVIHIQYIHKHTQHSPTHTYIHTHRYPCISQTFYFLIKVLKILVSNETHLCNSSTSFGLSFSFFTIFMDFFFCFSEKATKQQQNFPSY